MQTITRVYDSYGQARQVVADLEASGVVASDINLIASVHAADDRLAAIERIMDRHEPIDPAERRTIYTGEGWKRFDPAAAPYTPSQAEIDRLRRPYVN